MEQCSILYIFSSPKSNILKASSGANVEYKDDLWVWLNKMFSNNDKLTGTSGNPMHCLWSKKITKLDQTEMHEQKMLYFIT